MFVWGCNSSILFVPMSEYPGTLYEASKNEKNLKFECQENENYICAFLLDIRETDYIKS